MDQAAGSDAPSPRAFALPGHGANQIIAHITVDELYRLRMSCRSALRPSQKGDARSDEAIIHPRGQAQSLAARN